MNSHVELVSRYFVREPRVDGFFDAYSCSVQYVVADRDTGRCAIIDPLLDYDEKFCGNGDVVGRRAGRLRARTEAHSRVDSRYPSPCGSLRRPRISRRRRARGL